VRGDVPERICTSTQEGETAGCRLRPDRDRGSPPWAGSRPATWRLQPRRRQPTEGCNATGVWGTRGGGGPANQRHVRAHADMRGGGEGWGRGRRRHALHAEWGRPDAAAAAGGPPARTVLGSGARQAPPRRSCRAGNRGAARGWWEADEGGGGAERAALGLATPTSCHLHPLPCTTPGEEPRTRHTPAPGSSHPPLQPRSPSRPWLSGTDDARTASTLRGGIPAPPDGAGRKQRRRQRLSQPTLCSRKNHSSSPAQSPGPRPPPHATTPCSARQPSGGTSDGSGKRQTPSHFCPTPAARVDAHVGTGLRVRALHKQGRRSQLAICIGPPQPPPPPTTSHSRFGRADGSAG